MDNRAVVGSEVFGEGGFWIIVAARSEDETNPDRRNSWRKTLISPIAERLTPASSSHADWVEKIKRNGRPDKKPSVRISARRGSLKISRNGGDLRGDVMPEPWSKKD
jgi:hypothetical protein